MTYVDEELLFENDGEEVIGYVVLKGVWLVEVGGSHQQVNGKCREMSVAGPLSSVVTGTLGFAQLD